MARQSVALLQTRRVALGALVLAFYGEAFLIALPATILSLLLFDEVAPWFGPALAIAALGLTMLLGWRALQSLVSGSESSTSAMSSFFGVWTIYNGVVLAMALLV